jgi:hypothetical protein
MYWTQTKCTIAIHISGVAYALPPSAKYAAYTVQVYFPGPVLEGVHCSESNGVPQIPRVQSSAGSAKSTRPLHGPKDRHGGGCPAGCRKPRSRQGPRPIRRKIECKEHGPVNYRKVQDMESNGFLGMERVVTEDDSDVSLIEPSIF